MTIQAGARESNEGDQFHFVWSARKAMQLIRPGSGLLLLKVEGVTPADATTRIGTDEFLVADVTEYYGGQDFATANRSVISQLKYSVRHPAKAWTCARLTEAERKKPSLLRKFANAYTGFLRRMPAGDPADRLRLQLVSNQPVDARLAAVLRLIGAPAPFSRAAKDWARLQKSSGLTQQEFPRFLRCLDVSECGSAARQIQHVKLVQELATAVNNPVGTARELYQLIASHALVDTTNHPGLRKEDVLAWLQVGDEDRIFPAKPRWPEVANPISTGAVTDLATIIRNADKPVIAHGPAGIGKTTLLQMLEAQLPPGSILLLFDCYGKGTYEQSGESRHTHARALVQLINELAVHSNSALLLQPPASSEDLLRLFRRAVEAAARTLPANALLVIGIDAADNAITAAHGLPDCFVPSLWQVPLPANVRLLMSCRTHRRGSLRAPDAHEEYPLPGFDEPASATNLKRAYKEAGAPAIRRFHRQTGGNPRVQFYKLGEGKRQQLTLDDMLATASKTPEAMFDDLLQAAAQIASSTLDELADLVVLSRPTPLPVLDLIGGSKLRLLAESLVPGVTMEPEGVMFRDEDFEAFLRGKVSPEALVAAHQRVATRMRPLAASNEFCARHLADHLFHGSLHAELIELALAPDSTAAITDPFIRLQVRRRRLSLALRSAADLQRNEAAFQLLLQAAELNKTESALLALTRSDPNLAALYSDLETVRRLMLGNVERQWQGSLHAHLALIFARKRRHLERATEHRRLANAWLRKRAAQPPERRQFWELDDSFISRATETLYWMDGPVAAAKWMSSWSPAEAVARAFAGMVDGLVKHAAPGELLDAVRKVQPPPFATAIVMAAITREGGAVPSAEVRAVAARLASHPRYFNRYAKAQQSAAADFIELAASSRTGKRTLARLIDSVEWVRPRYRVHGPPSVREFDPFLRVRALAAALAKGKLEVTDLHPPVDPAKRHTGNDPHEIRYSFDDVFGRVINSYNLRGRVAALASDAIATAKDVQAFIDAARKPAESPWTKADWYLQFNARNLATVLAWTSAPPDDQVEALAGLAEQRVPDGRAEVWMLLAETCLNYRICQALGWRLLEKAAEALEHGAMPAKERWESFLRCAAIAARHDITQGRTYYERARKTAEDIDDDQIPLLTLQAHMTESLAGKLSAPRSAPAARRLLELVESHADLVSENEHLPWAQATAAAASLDLQAALERCTRWNDSRFADFNETLEGTLAGGLRTSQANSTEALALARLAGERFSPVTLALQAMDLAHARGSTGRIELSQIAATAVLWIRGDLPPEDRGAAAQAFLTGCETRGHSTLEVLATLREVVAFEEKLKKLNRYAPYTGELYTRKEKPPSKPRRPPPANNHSRVMRYAVSLYEQDFSSSDAIAYLVRTGRSQMPSHRVAFLDRLLDGDNPDRLQHCAQSVLAALLPEWEQISEVRQWLSRRLSIVLARAIDEEEYPRTDSWLKQLEGIATRINLPLAPALASVASDQLPLLSPVKVLKAARCVWREVTPARQAELLSWAFSQTEGRLKEVGRSLPPVASPPAISREENLARFLFVAMGHPDRHVRWRALHAARALCTASGTNYVAQFVSLLRSNDAHGHLDPKKHFFSMSAQVSVGILLLHLAGARPALLLPHASFLSDVALSESHPHALLREIAKRTISMLVAHDPQCLPPGTADKVALCNLPRSCSYPRPDPSAGYTDGWAHHGCQDHRYYFSEIDTVPYWFQPAARPFGITDREFCRRAEHWICDQWHWVEANVQSYHRDERHHDDWRLSHNDHGTIPRIETLPLYLEFHAMHCVSGNLADTMPCRISRYEDGERDWTENFGYRLGRTPAVWLSDLLQPTPYEPQLWAAQERTDAWLRHKTKTDYNTAIGVSPRKPLPAFLAVAGYYGLGDSERSGGIGIDSALVSPESARALLHALQSAGASHHVPFPSVDRVDDEETKEETPGFELRRWLAKASFSCEWQNYDTLHREFGGQFHILPPALAKKYQLSFRDWNWYFPDGARAGYSERWSDYSVGMERQHRDLRSGGERLWLSTQLIIQHLRAIQRDLILKVTLSRNSESRYDSNRKKKNEYDHGTRRIYLLRQSGNLEVVGSHHFAG